VPTANTDGVNVTISLSAPEVDVTGDLAKPVGTETRSADSNKTARMVQRDRWQTADTYELEELRAVSRIGAPLKR